MEQELSELVEIVSQSADELTYQPALEQLVQRIKSGVVFWDDLELDDALRAVGMSLTQINALNASHPIDKTAIIQHLLDELSKATLEDVLTQVYNRRYFERSMTAEIERSRRDQRPCGLVLLDIDHFKSFNDQYGHDIGDLVLKNVANTISQSLRSTDTISRVGGEEFAIIVPNTFRLDAGFLAERIRTNVERLTLEHDGDTLSVTISLGVAINDPRNPETLNELYKRADNALYDAKASGRNCVKFSITETEKSSSAVTADERNELLG